MILLSLIGQQPIPILLPARHLQPDENILLHTRLSEACAEKLARLLHNPTLLPFGDGYEIPQRELDQVRGRLQPGAEVMYNFTGGTKPMVMAMYQLALQTPGALVYLDSDKRMSILRSYAIRENALALTHKLTLPALISLDDYLLAHLPGYEATGFSKTEGGEFEQVVYQALKDDFEVAAGVRPLGVAHQIEIDLAVRLVNQVGIIEVKLGGGPSPKNGLDQLVMASEGKYLGTYTARFLVIARRLAGEANNLRLLATARDISLIELPGYRSGYPLTEPERSFLLRTIQQKLQPRD